MSMGQRLHQFTAIAELHQPGKEPARLGHARQSKQANWATSKHPRTGLTGRVNHALLAQPATPGTEAVFAGVSAVPKPPR